MFVPSRPRRRGPGPPQRHVERRVVPGGVLLEDAADDGVHGVESAFGRLNHERAPNRPRRGAACAPRVRPRSREVVRGGQESAGDRRETRRAAQARATARSRSRRPATNGCPPSPSPVRGDRARPSRRPPELPSASIRRAISSAPGISSWPVRVEGAVLRDEVLGAHEHQQVARLHGHQVVRELSRDSVGAIPLPSTSAALPRTMVPPRDSALAIV